MSRKGKLPIPVPKDVQITIKDDAIEVKGPKGQLTQHIVDGIEIKQEGDQIIVNIRDNNDEFGSFQGLMRTLVDNMVQGVTKGFSKTLTMIGVGYRAAVQGDLLDLQVGLSHPSKLKVPEGIQVKVEKNTTIIIEGADKQSVGQFAATVRSKRPPEPYQGKGIRYKDEFVRKKAGKAAAKK